MRTTQPRAEKREWCVIHHSNGHNGWCWAWAAGAAPQENGSCRLVTAWVVLERPVEATP